MRHLKLSTLITTLASTAALGVTSASPVLAELQNQAVSPALGSSSLAARSGATFALYFITLWRGIIVVGAIMLLIYFLWAAIEWITAGGDSGKITKARDRMTQSIVGFLILVSTVVIIAFLGAVFFGDSINLFQLTLPDPSALEAGSGTPAVPVTLPGGRITVP